MSTCKHCGSDAIGTITPVGFLCIACMDKYYREEVARLTDELKMALIDTSRIKQAIGLGWKHGERNVQTWQGFLNWFSRVIDDNKKLTAEQDRLKRQYEYCAKKQQEAVLTYERIRRENTELLSRVKEVVAERDRLTKKIEFLTRDFKIGIDVVVAERDRLQHRLHITRRGHCNLLKLHHYVRTTGGFVSTQLAGGNGALVYIGDRRDDGVVDHFIAAGSEETFDAINAVFYDEARLRQQLIEDTGKSKRALDEEQTIDQS